MLEEDSLIYSKEDRRPEKEQIRNMPFPKRTQYLFEYYAIYVGVALFVIAAIIFLAYHILKAPESTGLYVAVYNQAWSEESKADLEKLLRKEAGIAQDTSVYIDDSFFIGQNGLDKLQVYLANKQLDLVVASKADFKVLAGYGFFQDLGKVSGIPEPCRERLVNAAGYLETGEISLDDNETGRGEELFYGMELPENPWNQNESQKASGIVVSLAVDAPNEENAVCFMELLEKGKK